MRQAALSVGIASAVFFVLMTGIDVVLGDEPLTQEMLLANAFRTAIFGMAFAAIKTATIIFRDKTK